MTKENGRDKVPPKRDKPDASSEPSAAAEPYWKKLDRMSDEEIAVAYAKCQINGHTKSGEYKCTIPPIHCCSECGAQFTDSREVSSPRGVRD
jgi:hypothetical protein